MKLKDYILIESTREKIHQLIETRGPAPSKEVMDRLMARRGVDSPHNYTKELLPTNRLSDVEKKQLVKQIRLLRVLGDKKGLLQVLNHLNEKRRQYNLPQLTMQGLKNATRLIKRPGPDIHSGDVNWQQHLKDQGIKGKYNIAKGSEKEPEEEKTKTARSMVSRKVGGPDLMIGYSHTNELKSRNLSTGDIANYTGEGGGQLAILARISKNTFKVQRIKRGELYGKPFIVESGYLKKANVFKQRTSFTGPR
jgi:hypothetical protein